MKKQKRLTQSYPTNAQGGETVPGRGAEGTGERETVVGAHRKCQMQARASHDPCETVMIHKAASTRSKLIGTVLAQGRQRHGAYGDLDDHAPPRHVLGEHCGDSDD